MAVINKKPETLDFQLQFKRQFNTPLDNSEVYYSFTEAQNYAKNSAIAYVGQIVSVVNETTKTVDLYKIVNEAGDLDLIASSADVKAYTDEQIRKLLEEDGVNPDVVDSFKELQEYIEAHGKDAADMLKTITEHGTLLSSHTNSIAGLQEAVGLLSQNDTEFQAALDSERKAREEGDKALRDAISNLSKDDGGLGQEIYELVKSDLDNKATHQEVTNATADKATRQEVAELLASLETKINKDTNDRLAPIEEKLSGIESGAQVNKLEKVKINGTALAINSTDKSVNITVETELKENSTNPISSSAVYNAIVKALNTPVGSSVAP